MPQRISIILCSLLIFANGWGFWQQNKAQLSAPPNARPMALHNLGDKFNGLQDLFKDQHYVGYFTDKDMEHPLAVAQYEQAQFMLAPTVLVINKTDYKFVLFDCTSPQIAMAKIQELGLQPLKANDGVILALNPKWLKPS